MLNRVGISLITRGFGNVSNCFLSIRLSILFLCFVSDSLTLGLMLFVEHLVSDIRASVCA